MARSKQSHYFEVLNLFAIVAIILTVFVLRDQMNATIVTVFAAAYFIANIAYAWRTNHLDTMRIVEVGAIAVICEVIILNYII